MEKFSWTRKCSQQSEKGVAGSAKSRAQLRTLGDLQQPVHVGGGHAARVRYE